MSHSGTIATIERSEDDYRRYYKHDNKCVHKIPRQRWFTGFDEHPFEFDYVQLNAEVWNTEPPPPIEPRDMFADGQNYATSTPIASRAASVKSFDSSATFQQGRFTQRVVPTDSLRGSNQMQPTPRPYRAGYNTSTGHQQAYRPRAASVQGSPQRPPKNNPVNHFRSSSASQPPINVYALHRGNMNSSFSIKSANASPPKSRLNSSGSTQRSSDLSTSNIVPPYAQPRDDPFAKYDQPNSTVLNTQRQTNTSNFSLPKPVTPAASKSALFVPASTASRPAPPVLPDPPEPTPSERSVSPARSTVSGSSDAFSTFSMGHMYMPSKDGHRRKSKNKPAKTEAEVPVEVQSSIDDDALQQFRENSQRIIEERDAAKKAELEQEKAKHAEREARMAEKERKEAELKRAAAKKAENLKRAHKKVENAERLEEQREREQQVARNQEEQRIFQKAMDDAKLAADRQKAIEDADRKKALDDARIAVKLEINRAAKEREEAEAAVKAAKEAEKQRQEAERAEKKRKEAEEARKKQLEADAAAKRLEKQSQEPLVGASEDTSAQTGFINVMDYNSDQNLSGAESWDFNYNGTSDTDTDSFEPSAHKSSNENTVDSNQSEPLPVYSAASAQDVGNDEIIAPQRSAEIDLPHNGSSNNFEVTSRNRESETDVNDTLKSNGIPEAEKLVPNAEEVGGGDASKHLNAEELETDGDSFSSDSDEDVAEKPIDGPLIPLPEKPDDDLVEEVRRKMAEMSMAYQQVPEKRSDSASPRDSKLSSPEKVPDTTQGSASPEVDTILEEVRQRIEEVNESQNDDSEDDSALEKPDDTEALSQLQVSRTPQRVSEVQSSTASQYHSPLSSPMISATPRSATPTRVSAAAITAPSSPHIFETLPHPDAEELSTYSLIVAREILNAPGFVDTLKKVSPVGVVFGHYYLVINGNGNPCRGQVYHYEPATKKYRVFLNDENIFCAVKIDALRQMPADIATALGRPAVLYTKFEICRCATCTSMLAQPL